MTGGATEPWTQVASRARQHRRRTTALSFMTEPPGPTGLELGNGVRLWHPPNSAWSCGSTALAMQCPPVGRPPHSRCLQAVPAPPAPVPQLQHQQAATPSHSDVQGS